MAVCKTSGLSGCQERVILGDGFQTLGVGLLRLERERNAAGVDHLLVERPCDRGEIEAVVFGDFCGSALEAVVKSNGECRCSYRNPLLLRMHVHV